MIIKLDYLFTNKLLKNEFNLSIVRGVTLFVVSFLKEENSRTFNTWRSDRHLGHLGEIIYM